MAADHESSGLANSLTDLMTSLAVLFILLLVSMMNNTQQRARVTRNELLAELKPKFNSFVVPETEERISAEPDKNDPLSLLVRVPQGFLNFKTDEFAISEKGETFLDQFVPKLASTVCSDQFREQIGSIVVEGHADPRGSDEHNIVLSQNRASAVVIRCLASLNLPAERECFASLLSASGRGKGESEGKSLNEEEMARIRRVQFKIRVRSLEERELLQERLMPEPN
jgi:outer membrane protein OmpA-like peptidoglycan-associated protein